MDFKSFLTLCTCLVFLGQHHLSAQLSGIVNTYVKVTAVDYACNKITVTNPAGFAVNDKVLLIQMQGASIVQTNTVTFGDITSIDDAGNYEFAYIDHFAGNDVYFQKTLLRTYTPSGSVQMVSVPQYSNVSVDAEVVPQAWDGNTGGIVIIESSGTITLNANINASEKGFRGGDKSLYGGDCYTSSTIIYLYNYPTVQAGQKGEGIATYIANSGSGRAKNSTGGGGGNSHNTGGGGGGNYGAGGRGGDKKNTGCGGATSPFGYGAIGLSSTYYSPSNNKIFMGGGGGGGQGNNNPPGTFDAGAGGGIILLKANILNANGFLLKSNGGSVSSHYTNQFGDNGDGNSGGGAGGTILLDVLNYSASTAVEVFGGKGGDTGYDKYDFGPGGGGGGGVVWLASSTTSAMLTTNLTGGNSGISGSGTISGVYKGSGTSWGATNGSAGAQLSNLSIPMSGSASTCALPVNLLFFNAAYKGRYHVDLTWSTVKEENNAFFSIEKSKDGINFFLLNTIEGKNTSSALNNYQYVDEVYTPEILYYKLLQTDIDGTTKSLGIKVVYPEKHTGDFVAAVYPNPFNENLNLQFSEQSYTAIQQIYFSNNLSELFFIPYSKTNEGILLNTSSLPLGMYTLVLQTKEHVEYHKVVKK